MTAIKPTARQPRQRGVTMLVVLVLMTVMLMGGIALARMTEIGTMAAGNSLFREVSLQASEVGLNNAFAQVSALPDESLDTGGWYWSTPQPVDTEGVPTINWAGVPATNVGAYDVRVVAERLCSVAAVTDRLAQCLVAQKSLPTSAAADTPTLDPPNATQYRITARVLGPKGTLTWVQALMTRGT